MSDSYDKILERARELHAAGEQGPTMFKAMVERIDALDAELERLRGYAGAPPKASR